LGKPAFGRVFSLSAAKEPGHPVFIYDGSANDGPLIVLLTMKIVSVGEILWDLVEGREFLGGAPLNFALHAARLGHQALMVSAVGDDDRGLRSLAEISARALRTDFISRVPGHPTGTVTVKMSHHGVPDYVIHRPAAYDFPVLDAAALNSLASPPPDWIYFGTLQQLSPAAQQVLQTILAAAPHARRCYDINLRRDSYIPGLIQNLLSAADVLKLNEDEISEIAGLLPNPSGRNDGKSNLEQFCRSVSLVFNLQAVCVTCGANGCALLLGDEYVTASAPSITVADTIGAGDAFCAALVHGIGRNWPAGQIAGFASRVGALVASRYGGSPEWHPSEIAVMT